MAWKLQQFEAMAASVAGHSIYGGAHGHSVVAFNAESAPKEEKQPPLSNPPPPTLFLRFVRPWKWGMPSESGHFSQKASRTWTVKVLGHILAHLRKTRLFCRSLCSSMGSGCIDTPTIALCSTCDILEAGFIGECIRCIVLVLGVLNDWPGLR